MSTSSIPSEAALLTPSRKKRSIVKIVIFITTILLLLISLIMAAQAIVTTRTQNLPPMATMKSLEIAVRSYKTEYLRLPAAKDPIPTEEGTILDTSSADGLAFLNVLLAVTPERNPRHIRFWDGPSLRKDGSGFSAEKGLVDQPSRRGFRIVLDYNDDGIITDPSGGPTPISSDVILYSAGRDGDFNTWTDNICSWK